MKKHLVALLAFGLTLTMIAPLMATAEVATNTTKTTKSKATTQLTRDEIKKIAYEQVPDGTIVKMEMDYEHGKAVYEIDVRKGAAEYDLEIDATTGTVYKCEVDY